MIQWVLCVFLVCVLAAAAVHVLTGPAEGAAASRSVATAELTDALVAVGMGDGRAAAICAKLTVVQMRQLTERLLFVTDRIAALEQDGRPRVNNTVAGLDSLQIHDVYVDTIRAARFPGGSVICFWTVPGRTVIVRSFPRPNNNAGPRP